MILIDHSRGRHGVGTDGGFVVQESPAETRKIIVPDWVFSLHLVPLTFPHVKLSVSEGRQGQGCDVRHAYVGRARRVRTGADGSSGAAVLATTTADTVGFCCRHAMLTLRSACLRLRRLGTAGDWQVMNLRLLLFRGRAGFVSP